MRDGLLSKLESNVERISSARESAIAAAAGAD